MSGYLIDTNVISEFLRPLCNERVRIWMEGVDREQLFVSVVTLGEFRKGLGVLPAGARRERLREAITDHLPAWFGTRILPVTQPIAECWGEFEAKRQLMGRPLNVPDAQIAATAFLHRLTLVTRNSKDFQDLGVALFDPWV